VIALFLVSAAKQTSTSMILLQLHSRKSSPDHDRFPIFYVNTVGCVVPEQMTSMDVFTTPCIAETSNDVFRPIDFIKCRFPRIIVCDDIMPFTTDQRGICEPFRIEIRKDMSEHLGRCSSYESRRRSSGDGSHGPCP
jgi:hypothetical protein